MENQNLPEGWTQIRFDQFLDFQNGFAFKSNDYEKEGAFVIRIGNVQDAHISLDKPAYVNVSKLGAELFSLKNGDILISLTGNVGRVAQIEAMHLPAVLNQRVARVLKPLDISASFVCYLLRSSSVQKNILKNAKGAAQLNISTKDIKNIFTVFPPATEQIVIAEKLDKMLVEVEATKSQLTRTLDTLKKFRQSVLAAAVSGKLTEGWRGGEAFNPKTSSLKDFVSIDIGFAFKSKEFTESGVRLLRGQNIEPGALKWQDTKYFPEGKLDDLSHLFIKFNDIILAMDRPIISSGLKLARAKADDLPCVLVQRVARFKSYNGLLPDYLYMLLSDVSFINYLQPNQTGSDIPHISGKQILGFGVSIPSINEQTEIVRQVKVLFSGADKIEAQTQVALNRVNQMTQSILAKAFRGELTANWREQNPDLITGDKTAEALLTKIQEERAKQKPNKRTKAKR